MAVIRLDLDQLRVDLAAAEARVRDLRALIDLTERLYGSQLATEEVDATADDIPLPGPSPQRRREERTFTPDFAEPTHEPSPQDLRGMDTQRAALRVMRERAGTEFKVEALAPILWARGWRVEKPHQALASALGRAHRKRPDMVAKPRYGHYVYIGPSVINSRAEGAVVG